jgi:hypothetical protein
MIGAAAMIFAGCAGDTQPAEDTSTVPLTTDAAGTAQSDLDAATATLAELAGSGVTGTVRLVPAATGTSVTVTLTGAREGVHQGHIHAGTCTNRGAAVVPLSPITVAAGGTGEATSTVEVPIATVRNGNHIVVYHEAGGAPGQAVTCAEIPADATAPAQDTATPPQG